MRANIYIRKENEEAWEQLADKSMRVNHWIATMQGSPSTLPIKDDIQVIKDYEKLRDRRKRKLKATITDLEGHDDAESLIKSKWVSEKNTSEATPLPIMTKTIPLEEANLEAMGKLRQYPTPEIYIKKMGLCKHGADPAFCKHAKPGKECK